MTARVRYIQTDTLWDITWLNFFSQPLILFDSATDRFFVSDTSLNRVEVIDASTETKIGDIPVPGAFVGDISPDHSTIYLGTQVGDLYEIDPVAMSVKARMPAAQIGPSGFPAYEVKALADGTLAMLSGQGGIPAVDGYSALGIWNPTTNALSIAGSTGPDTVCPPRDHIAEMRLTADRTKILLGSGLSGAGLCMYDPSSGSQAVVETNPSGIGIGAILVPPDGNEILVGDGSQVAVYSSSSLNLIDQFSLPASTTASYNLILSADGTTIFAVDRGGGPSIAYNWRTHQQVGWIPAYSVYDSAFEGTAVPMAVDSTGLIACSIGHGVALLDGSATMNLQPGTGYFLFEYANVLDPAFGPVQGGNQAVLTGVGLTNVHDVNFGSQSANIVSTGSSGLTVTAPQNSAGPVDVSMHANDGSFLFLPQSYSYGPTIVETSTNGATADGGATGTIYGYGFGSADDKGQAPDLQLSVGGLPATITQYTAQPQSEYPFPIESAQFVIPPGSAGEQVSVGVSNSDGSATESNAIQYLPPVQQYPLTGAVLVQGIYDPRRDVYYFTDATQIRVFSKTKGAWLASIPMPPTAQRLWGISLSPDGSKLAVSDAVANLIFVLDPDLPSAISSFAGPSQAMDQGQDPCGLAVTDSGIVYFATFSLDYTGGWAFHKLDTTTATVSDYHFSQIGNLGGDAFIRVLLTSDGSRVYFNNGGSVISMDTATETFYFNPTLSGFDYELTLSSNQTWMSATEYLMDTNLNLESYVDYVDRDTWNETAVYGEKISPDGNLLFSPLSNAIDVIDGKTGDLRTRVALPLTLSPNYDALVDDGVDNVLIAITGDTGNGIAVIDLGALPEPAHFSEKLRAGSERAAASAAMTSAVELLPGSRAALGKPSNPDLAWYLKHNVNSPALRR